MSDHSAAIQHIEILQEQAMRSARDGRETIRVTAEYATVKTIIGIASTVDEHMGADDVYTAFLVKFRETGDVEAAKDAAYQTVQANVDEQSDRRRTGMRAAFKHIVGTFPAPR
ncbi:hypothetical protein [Aeromicrobium sp. 179-A 4D2 NHS]|uniref:hypothetical protein n=1 Tax=Aeromicrobium sp. 179-A 4D2 NHS TaxID=3142375 RepID=UPI0039A2ECE4